MQRLLYTCCLASVILALLELPASGQFQFDWVATGVGDWENPDNWSEGLLPIAEADEMAGIENGGTAQVTGMPPNVGGLTLGPGRLEILSSGSLDVEPGFLAAGAVNVEGTGSMFVASGGSFQAESLISAGTLEVDSATAAFDVVNDLVLTATSDLRPRISGPNFSAISVGGASTINGAMTVDFDGVTPSVADSWDLFDANSIVGTFDSITASESTEMGLGQVLAVRTQPGGANGVVAQLVVEQRLVLTIDRATGMAGIQNPGAAPISLDGYSIQSSVGSLESAAWNSLADQTFDDGNWFEIGTGGSSNTLGELNPNTTSSFAASANVPIGQVFDPNFVTLGEETEDLEFRYTAPDNTSIMGVVNYVGDKQFNNLVLTVNPDSGEATLQNESEIPVSFDAYAITSESGSLLSGDANWDSLEDSGAAGEDWFEIDADSFTLGELKASGTTTLSQGQGFNLGTLFDVSGMQDLTFEFLREEESLPFMGVVVYGELPDLGGGGGGIVGDFNNNGLVEQQDLDLVLGNWGTSAAEAPATWENDLPEGNIDQTELDKVLANWGNTAGLGNAAAVPEPHSIALLITGLLGTLLVQRLRR